MSIANQAFQTGKLSMPHLEYFYITLVSPGRLYSAKKIKHFELPGFEPALELMGSNAIPKEPRPLNFISLFI